MKKIIFFVMLLIVLPLMSMEPAPERFNEEWQGAKESLEKPSGYLQTLPRELQKETAKMVEEQNRYDLWSATEIKKALDSNNATQLEEVLKKGANANVLIQYVWPSGQGVSFESPIRYLLEHKPRMYFQSLATLLLKYGANINEQDEKGKTFLHREIISPDYETIQFMLQHGADPNIQQNNGKTALDLIDQNIHGKAYQLHRRYGAKTSDELERTSLADVKQAMEEGQEGTYLGTLPQELIADIYGFTGQNAKTYEEQKLEEQAKREEERQERAYKQLKRGHASHTQSGIRYRTEPRLYREYEPLEEEQ